MFNKFIVIGTLAAGTMIASADVTIEFSQFDLTSPPDRLVRYDNVPGHNNGDPVSGTQWAAQLFFAGAADNDPAAVSEAPSRFFATTGLPFPNGLDGTWNGGSRNLIGAN